MVTHADEEDLMPTPLSSSAAEADRAGEAGHDEDDDRNTAAAAEAQNDDCGACDGACSEEEACNTHLKDDGESTNGEEKRTAAVSSTSESVENACDPSSAAEEKSHKLGISACVGEVGEASKSASDTTLDEQANVEAPDTRIAIGNFTETRSNNDRISRIDLSLPGAYHVTTPVIRHALVPPPLRRQGDVGRGGGSASDSEGEGGDGPSSAVVVNYGEPLAAHLHLPRAHVRRAPPPRPGPVPVLEVDAVAVDDVRGATSSNDGAAPDTTTPSTRCMMKRIRNRRIAAFAVALAICAAIGVAIAVPLSAKGDRDSSQGQAAAEDRDPQQLPLPSMSPSDPPSAEPTRSPTLAPSLPSVRRAAVKALLESHAPVPVTFPGDASSPQHRALAWIADEDERRVPLEHVQSLVQRYALATLYFATGGGVGERSSWIDELGFLSVEHECRWNAMVAGYYNWPAWWIKDAGFVDPPMFFEKGVFCREDNSTVDGIWLVANNMTGTIPNEIGLLSHLKQLRVSTNKLEGSLPDSMEALSELEHLWCSFNNAMRGTVPSWFASLGKLKAIMFDGTPVEGTLPAFLTSMPALEALDFGPACFLNGTIPSFGPDGGSTPLRTLSLDFCDLTGTIPPSIFSLPNLTSLYLRANKLRGTLPPNMGDAVKLELLDLGNLEPQYNSNDLSGTLPEGLFDLKDLRYINLLGNSLNGTLSSSFGRLKKLEFLGLGANAFSGTVPETLAQLTNLDVLSLSINDLSGDFSFVCNISAPFSFADCYGVSAEVNCSCCTYCCSDELFLSGIGLYGCIPNG